MTTISKNVYIDVLNGIVNKYNNMVLRTIKMKPIDVTGDSYVEYNEDFNKRGPKFKVNDHVRISKYKNIFAKGYVSNWSEEVFIVNEIKNTVPWTYTISHLNDEKVIGTFYEKELQKFPAPSSHKENIKVEIDLSNYATKRDINDITHVDTSNFALKTNLSSLKTEVDKLYIDKLATITVDLRKLSNVVKNDVVKKTVYDKLVAKVNNTDTSDFVLKTNFNTKFNGLENKIPNTSDLVKKTDYNTKITEIENIIPDISGLATKIALIAVENKIPSISNLATKTALTTVENKIPSISGLVKKNRIQF